MIRYAFAQHGAWRLVRASACVAAAIALSVPALPAQAAETLYIVDQLVVSVASEPHGSEHVATVHSGDSVEPLGREGDETRVRLPNGTEGWVKSSYLSATEPLQQRLSERTAEVEKLKQEVSRLQSDLVAARSAAKTTSSAAPDAGAASPSTGAATDRRAPQPVQAAQAAPAPVTAAADNGIHDASYFMTSEEQPLHIAWLPLLVSSAAALAVGFALGWRVLDRRIRRKYGGLRIY